GVLLGIVWFWLYRDPEAHPDLSPDERAYITSGREPPAGAKPSFGAILSKTKFLGIIIARFLTEPAWQTFAFWIPLYMVSVRGMDIKQFALFAWLPFLFSDIGCIFGGLSRADQLRDQPHRSHPLFFARRLRASNAVQHDVRADGRRVREAGGRDGDRHCGDVRLSRRRAVHADGRSAGEF